MVSVSEAESATLKYSVRGQIVKLEEPGDFPYRQQQEMTVEKGNAVALCGAVVLSFDGSRVEFQKKCEHCGSLQSGTTKAPFGGGRGSVTSGSFPCMKCKRMNEYRIAGT